MQAEASSARLWVSARQQSRWRWTAALVAAVGSFIVATNFRHDSAGVLLALCAYATGALLATGQVGMLMHRYGGSRPSSAHLGDAQEISVSRPGVLTTLTPLATAGFVAVAFLLTADSRFASDRSALTLIVFGSVCSLWAGLDTIAAILTGRWERASGLGIYCPRSAGLFGRAQHVVVVEGRPGQASRWALPAIVICAVALLALAITDLVTLAQNESPWTRDLPTLSSDTGVSHIDPNFGLVASTLAGHSVQVRCWSVSDWAHIRRVRGDHVVGFTIPGTWTTQLSPSVCRPLMALRYRDVEPAGHGATALSFAVVVFGHEVGHLVRGSNESAAECFGLQAARQTAHLLRADPVYATRLETLYRNRIYPHRAAIYRASPCLPNPAPATSP
jgi:hypothetical protein